MDDLIPIEEGIEENVRVKELEKQGFIINSNSIEDYLNDFKYRITALPNENFWKKKGFSLLE